MGYPGLVGADPDQVDDLARRLSAAADRIDDIQSMLGRQLARTHWEGPGADDFWASWQRTHARILRSATTALRAAAVKAQRNAAEQRGTSRPDDRPAGAGVGAIGVGVGAVAGAAARLAGPRGDGDPQTPPPGELPDDGHHYHVGPPTAPVLTHDNDFPYDPEAEATWGDRWSWLQWKAKLEGAQLIRPDLDDATSTYEHYLDGSGTDMRIDYEEAYSEDAAIRRAVDNEIALAQQEVERIISETGSTSFQITGNPTSVAGSNYPETENWQKALGSHTIYGTATVVVNGDQVTMHITMHAEDMYNFNKGMADIATEAPDDENGRFATLGWAKEFRTYGDLERTITWTIGEPGSVVQTGGGTDLDRGGEDRVDGRGSG